MKIDEQVVLFRLSPEGMRALRGLVPPIGSFQAYVVEQEELGLLVDTRVRKAKSPDQNIPVMLLRWDYIATMSFEYRREIRPERARPGITPP